MSEIRADIVIIGSGFGGTMAAHVLVEAGHDVVVIERGAWPMHEAVPGAPRTLRELDPFFRMRRAYQRGVGGNGAVPGQHPNVGGPSLYFAAVSSRFRAADFEPAPEIIGDSGADWPYRYDDIEPFYSQAEQLLGIAGPLTGGTTEPRHSTAYAQQLGGLTAPAERLHDAAVRLGLRPFRLPLAINYDRRNGRTPCATCPYCDGFPCLIGAKNDLTTQIVPRLVRGGLRIEANTTVTRLIERNDRVVAVETIRTRTGERVRFAADTFILAAGALASPHLLLASGLEQHNPAGDLVGRYLMRHCNAHVFGIFARPVDRERIFHKQIGIDDFYFGHPDIADPSGKLGSIQQMATPWTALVMLPRAVAPIVARLAQRMTGFLVIAEDQPRPDNRVTIDGTHVDELGVPRLQVHYRNTKRDVAARNALIRQARRILREAGTPVHVVWRINTFSHGVGTLRMGRDPHASVLDEYGRYRGVDNLFVTDGSTMPTSAGMNPSLTIAANALRSAAYIAGELSPARHAVPAREASA